MQKELLLEKIKWIAFYGHCILFQNINREKILTTALHNSLAKSEWTKPRHFEREQQSSKNHEIRQMI